MRGIQLWGSSHSLDAGADQVVTHSRLYTQAKRVNANQNQGGSPQQDQGKRGTISVSSKERVQIQRQKMRIDVLDQGDEELARKWSMTWNVVKRFRTEGKWSIRMGGGHFQGSSALWWWLRDKGESWPMSRRRVRLEIAPFCISCIWHTPWNKSHIW